MRTHGFFRFSLTTLVLATIFVGALLGCGIHRYPFEHKFDLPPSMPNSSPFLQHNDNMAFNDKGDKLVVFRSCGQHLELFDLPAQQSMWKSQAPTCYGHVVFKFIDVNDRLVIGDYGALGIGSRPFVMTSIDIATGKDNWRPAYNNENLDWSIRQALHGERSPKNTWNEFSHAPALYKTAKSYQTCLMDFAVKQNEWAIPSPYVSDTPQAICKIHRQDDSDIDMKTDTPVVAARYSEDGDKLALLDDAGTVSIWKRVPLYESRHLIASPFFWIAIVAGLGLCTQILKRATSLRPASPRLADGA